MLLNVHGGEMAYRVGRGRERERLDRRDRGLPPEQWKC